MPPPVTDDEKLILRVIASAENHPLEWEQVRQRARLAENTFGDGIAHLVAHGFIDSWERRPGCLGHLFGAKEQFFFYLTAAGEDYMRVRGRTSAREDSRDDALNESPEDRRAVIEDAVRVFQDQFGHDPIYGPVRWRDAAARLDEDVKQEIEAAARTEHQMWDEFQRRFGHRGPAGSPEEAALRDPVIVRTVVRMFRAKDEQLRRLNLPVSQKPPAWPTHYHGGQIDLPPAPWEAAT